MVGRRHALLLAATIGLLSCAGPSSSGAPTPSVAPGSLRALANARGVYIGSATMAAELTSDAPYRALTAREFSMLTPANELKWDATEPQRGTFTFAKGDQIVSFATANGLRVRGHTLVWHSQLPGWLTSGRFAAEELRSILRAHITAEVTHYAGTVYAWDVVNEPFAEDGGFRRSTWFTTLGPGYIAEALRTAHAADPAAKLYVNDYNVEGVNAKSDALYALVRSLRAAGAPIDGVGLQAHLSVGQVPSTMRKNIERFAALGVDVAITELDVRITLPATVAALRQQAVDYRAVAAACLAVSRCRGVTVWDATDKYSWVPSFFPGQGAALPFDDKLVAKPAWTALHQAYS